MATRSRITAQRTAARPPSRARPTLDLRVRLLRLAAVAAVTGLVVAAWGLTDSDSDIAVTGPAESVTITQAGATLTAPAPEVAPATARPTLSADERPAFRLLPDALPRPPEPPEPARPARFERFVVQRGDTLYDISVVYEASMEEILRFNLDLGDGTRLDVGQTVLVPIWRDG